MRLRTPLPPEPQRWMFRTEQEFRQARYRDAQARSNRREEDRLDEALAITTGIALSTFGLVVIGSGAFFIGGVNGVAWAAGGLMSLLGIGIAVWKRL